MKKLWNKTRLIGIAGIFSIATVIGSSLVKKESGEVSSEVAWIISHTTENWNDNSTSKNVVLEGLIHIWKRSEYEISDVEEKDGLKTQKFESKNDKKISFTEYRSTDGRLLARESIGKDKKRGYVVFFNSEWGILLCPSMYPGITGKKYLEMVKNHTTSLGWGRKLSEFLHIFSKLGFIYVSDTNAWYQTLHNWHDTLHTLEETFERARRQEAIRENNTHGKLFWDCEDFAEIMRNIINSCLNDENAAHTVKVPLHATCIYREPDTGILSTVCTLWGVYRWGKKFGQDYNVVKMHDSEALNAALSRYFWGGKEKNYMRKFMAKSSWYPLNKKSEVILISSEENWGVDERYVPLGKIFQ